MRKANIAVSNQAPEAIDLGFCPVSQTTEYTFVLETTQKETIKFRYSSNEVSRASCSKSCRRTDRSSPDRR